MPTGLHVGAGGREDAVQVVVAPRAVPVVRERALGRQRVAELVPLVPAQGEQIRGPRRLGPPDDVLPPDRPVDHGLPVLRVGQGLQTVHQLPLQRRGLLLLERRVREHPPPIDVDPLLRHM